MMFFFLKMAEYYLPLYVYELSIMWTDYEKITIHKIAFRWWPRQWPGQVVTKCIVNSTLRRTRLWSLVRTPASCHRSSHGDTKQIWEGVSKIKRNFYRMSKYGARCVKFIDEFFTLQIRMFKKFFATIIGNFYLLHMTMYLNNDILLIMYYEPFLE